MKLRAGLFRELSTITLLLLAGIGALSMQHWARRSGWGRDKPLPSDFNLLYMRGIAALGWRRHARLCGIFFYQAFVGCFVTGICAAGYWGVLGWSDTPIVIGSPNLELLFRALIALLTVVVSALVIYRVARTSLALFIAGTKHHARAGLRIATSDPVLNSYLFFIVIMFAMYVATNNAFGISGRHWYPFIFPAFLCFVWYAPRALNRKHQVLSTIFACALLAYSVIAATFAGLDVAHRYYSPQSAKYVVSDRLPVHAIAQAIGALWPLEEGRYVFEGVPGQFSYDRGTEISVSGAAMENRDTGASQVSIFVDHRIPVAVLAKQYLFGIAEAAHSVTGGYSGFGGYIATSSLPEGPHVVSASASIAGREANVAPARLFFVTSANGRFSPRFERSLLAAHHLPGMIAAPTACRGAVVNLAATTTVGQGAVVLLSGSATVPPSGTDVVWALLDNQPYPGVFAPQSGHFTILVPIKAAHVGSHALKIYVSHALRSSPGLLGTISLRVSATKTGRTVANTRAECSDPLKELAPI